MYDAPLRQACQQDHDVAAASLIHVRCTSCKSSLSSSWDFLAYLRLVSAPAVCLCFRDGQSRHCYGALLDLHNLLRCVLAGRFDDTLACHHYPAVRKCLDLEGRLQVGAP